MLQADLITDLTTCKSNVEDLTHKIQCLVQPCNDIDTLTTVKQYLQSAISVLEAKNLYPKEDYFTPTITPAPNSNHEKQPRFFSTKSKRKITSKRWAKPSKDEADEVKSKLMNSEIICGKCWKEEDTSNDDTEIPWIQCDICELWIHVSCHIDNEIDMEGQYNFIYIYVKIVTSLINLIV